MKIKNHSIRRVVYGFSALALAVAALVPALAGHASAAQITSRSIEMSSSTQGATATYSVTYTPSGTTSTAGIVVDFCDNDPIIGDTSCTFPTGFDVLTSPTVTFTSGITTTGWTAAGVQGGAGAGHFQTLKLSNSGAPTVAGTAINFTIAGVINPTTVNHSFYARIVTFDTTANMANYTVSTTTRAATFTGMVDYGGIALSTGSVINITARVMESLAFCVYKSACGDDPSMTIGHGANNILDATAVNTGNALFSISTNAQTGAFIRWKGAVPTSGANTIPSVNSASSASAPSTITAGTAAFGLAVPSGTLGTNITVPAGSAAYGGNGTTTFGMYTTGVTSTYGDIVAQLSGPVNNSVTTVTFGATASNTTPAGIYTAAEQLIATGTF
ncbi:MAG: hypothetical protein ACQR33_05520 [Candidatus Saccharibacteria bacterium]